MAEIKNQTSYRDKWKTISRKERPQDRPGNRPVVSITTPDAPKENVVTTVKTKISKMEYLVYDKKPLCMINGVLYTMMPIANPSLGYKLIPGGIDPKLPMLNPKFITEDQAIKMLFNF